MTPEMVKSARRRAHELMCACEGKDLETCPAYAQTLQRDQAASRVPGGSK